jgi:hypothetical protein
MTLPWLTLPVLALGAAWMAAVALAVWAFRGRLVGDAPHCRHCKYNLTGLTSNNCPECGFAITVAGVISGYRQRRTALLAIGAALAFVSASGLGLITYGRVTRVVWYTYSPVSLLLRMARENDGRAFAELHRRTWSDTLPHTKMPEVVSTALAEHGTETSASSAAGWANILTMLRDRGCLTSDQVAKFYGQLARVTLRVRRTIRQGDPIPYSVLLDDRSGSALQGRLKLAIRTSAWRRDGEPYDGPTAFRDRDWACLQTMGTFEAREVCSTIEGGSRSVLMQPGTHKLECTLTQAVTDVSGGCTADDALWSGNVLLDGTFDIVPESAPDPIRLIDQAALSDILNGTISIRRLTRYSPSHDGRDLLLARISHRTFGGGVRTCGRGHEVASGACSRGPGGRCDSSGTLP